MTPAWSVLTYNTPPDVILDRLLSHSKQAPGLLGLELGSCIMAFIFPKFQVLVRKEVSTT
jgi:hypothetical protein